MKKRPWVVGLIGGIGSGKSTVASLFGELGAQVWNADTVVHELLDRPDVRRSLVRTWGEGIAPRGRVDRAALARVGFRDAASVRRLNAVLHPHVRRALRRAVACCRRSVLVLDAPLLLEAGGAKGCDRIVFVEAPEGVRLRRVKRRGWSPAELRRRERFQWPLEKKRKWADFIVDNGGSRAAAARQVRSLLRDLEPSSHP